MDLIILLSAIFLAYGGIILLYYRLRAKERKNRISEYMLKGTRSTHRGNPEKALFYFNRAYEYSINTKNIIYAAEALYNMGYIYKEKGDISTAMKYWKESDDLYMEINENNE
ncbi:MAG TPA: hypothetical protein VK426_03995 [Methanobacterium sp.]|nr:hypothetical protein [Methanobacterium sp.]